MKRALLVLLCAGLLSDIAVPPVAAQSSTRYSRSRLEMPLSERLAALPEAPSSVAAEAPGQVLSLEAPLAHSYLEEGVGRQAIGRGIIG
jgi:hypothetical protein